MCIYIYVYIYIYMCVCDCKVLFCIELGSLFRKPGLDGIFFLWMEANPRTNPSNRMGSSTSPPIMKVEHTTARLSNYISQYEVWVKSWNLFISHLGSFLDNIILSQLRPITVWAPGAAGVPAGIEGGVWAALQIQICSWFGSYQIVGWKILMGLVVFSYLGLGLDSGV